MRNGGADLPSGLDAIESGKPDVQQNQVRLKLFSFLDGLKSIRSFGDNLPVRTVLEQLDNHTPPGCTVVDKENTS